MNKCELPCPSYVFCLCIRITNVSQFISTIGSFIQLDQDQLIAFVVPLTHSYYCNARRHMCSSSSTHRHHHLIIIIISSSSSSPTLSACQGATCALSDSLQCYDTDSRWPTIRLKLNNNPSKIYFWFLVTHHKAKNKPSKIYFQIRDPTICQNKTTNPPRYIFKSKTLAGKLSFCSSISGWSRAYFWYLALKIFSRLINYAVWQTDVHIWSSVNSAQSSFVNCQLTASLYFSNTVILCQWCHWKMIWKRLQIIFLMTHRIKKQI